MYDWEIPSLSATSFCVISFPLLSPNLISMSSFSLGSSFFMAPCRNHNDWHARPFPKSAQNFHTIHIRKPQIQNNGIRPLQSGLTQAKLLVFTLADMVACAGQRQVQKTAYLPFIVNNQYICRKVAHEAGGITLQEHYRAPPGEGQAGNMFRRKREPGRRHRAELP